MKSGEIIRVKLIWKNSNAGRYNVGVKILGDENKKDINDKNSRLFKQDLIILGYEKNKPTISNVQVLPTTTEQGGTVSISAKVTDDTGINSVKLEIITPANNVIKEQMVNTDEADEYIFRFKDTTAIGKYTFTIIAEDLTIHPN